MAVSVVFLIVIMQYMYDASHSNIPAMGVLNPENHSGDRWSMSSLILLPTMDGHFGTSG